MSFGCLKILSAKLLPIMVQFQNCYIGGIGWDVTFVTFFSNSEKAKSAKRKADFQI